MYNKLKKTSKMVKPKITEARSAKTLKELREEALEEGDGNKILDEFKNQLKKIDDENNITKKNRDEEDEDTSKNAILALIECSSDEIEDDTKEASETITEEKDIESKDIENKDIENKDIKNINEKSIKIDFNKTTKPDEKIEDKPDTNILKEEKEEKEDDEIVEDEIDIGESIVQYFAKKDNSLFKTMEKIGTNINGTIIRIAVYEKNIHTSDIDNSSTKEVLKGLLEEKLSELSSISFSEVSLSEENIDADLDIKTIVENALIIYAVKKEEAGLIDRERGDSKTHLSTNIPISKLDIHKIILSQERRVGFLHTPILYYMDIITKELRNIKKQAKTNESINEIASGENLLSYLKNLYLINIYQEDIYHFY